MGDDLLGRRHLPWLSPLLWAFLCFSQLPRAKGEQANHNGDNQVREAVRQAIELVQPEANVDQLQMSERNDLDEELSRIAKTTSGPISFYSFYDIDSSSDDGSLWVVVPAGSSMGSDELYSFESSDSLGQSSEKFNRLLSHLTLSISDDKAASIARLFLGCCVREAHGETVSDEDGLRHSVERYYIRIYGDVWRALEAYTQWWQAYQKTAVHLPPTVVVEGGVRRIALERLILSFGMHPQLQRWEIAVSSDGSVSVLAVESIFPKQSRWLSYAFRSTVDPRIH